MSIEDRREFLKKSVVAGGVSLAMPTLASLKFATFHSPVAGEFSYGGGELPELDYTLDELLSKHGSQFEANANPAAIFAGIARLLTIGAAAVTIMQWLGIRSPFSRRPSFDDAKQCTEQYGRAQDAMISRGANYFSDVTRPVNDVSAMLGGTSPNPSDTVEVATQHGNLNAVPLTGRDPGVLIASLEGLREKYPGDERFAPYVINAFDKSATRLPDGAPGIRYETPIHTVIYDNRPRPQYNAGIAYLHRKADRRDPNNQYWMGLYV